MPLGTPPHERVFLKNFFNVCKLIKESNKFIERDFATWIELVAFLYQVDENEFYEFFESSFGVF